MAAGDISSVTVNADGKSVDIKILSITAGGTYAYDGLGSSSGLVQSSTAKIVLIATSKGFDSAGSATTIARTVYGTKVQRVPGTAGLAETVSGSDLIITFALSEPIYQKDNTGGGNSGTAVTYTILSGLYTKTGVPSNAGTGTATNSSTLAYYTPRGQWDRTPDLQLVGSNFTLRFDPQYLHGYAGISAVRFTSVGQTSANSVDTYVTSRTARQAAGTSLYTDSYVTTVPISGYTQGESIKNRVRVYPAIGDTAFDTDVRSTASDYAVQCDSTLTLTCDKTAALTVYGIVVTGSPGGTASANIATARADPFPTIQAALIAGASLVYYKNQAHTFSTPGSTPAALGYWRTVTPDPTDLGGIVLIDTGFVTFKTDIHWLGGTLKLTGNLSILTSTTKYLWFDGVTFNKNGQTLAAAFLDDTLGGFFTDCVFDDPSAWKLTRQGGDIVRMCFDGCDFGTGSATAITAFWKMVACKGTGVNPAGSQSTTVTVANIANQLFKNNRFLSVDAGIAFHDLGGALTDYFILGNVVEAIGLSTPAFAFVDGTTENNLDHVVFSHNTLLGQRENYAYNDYGAAAIYRRGWSIRNNVFGNQEIKSDLFTPANAARVGNWWDYYGTQNSGNFARLSDFPPDYSGLSSTLSAADPLFTDDRSGNNSGGASNYQYNANSGLGGGTYSILSGSPLRSLLLANTRHSAYDLAGTAIPNDGTGATGAYQFPITTGNATWRQSGANVLSGNLIGQAGVFGVLV
jgi:hypothetical protein